MTVNDVVAVGYADNFNEIIVDSNEAETTGVLNVAADPQDPTHYVVSADLDFSGTTLKLRFDGNAHGFSQSPDLYMEFDGKVFSKAEGYSGTVTVGLDGGMLIVDATNYNGLQVTYQGPCQISE